MNDPRTIIQIDEASHSQAMSVLNIERQELLYHRKQSVELGQRIQNLTKQLAEAQARISELETAALATTDEGQDEATGQ